MILASSGFLGDLGVTGLWTVRASGSGARACDAFLLISTTAATRVLATQDELQELSGR